MQKYTTIMTLENILLAWEEFLRGKRKREDVLAYQVHLMDNLFALQKLLVEKTYVHGNYKAFNISDPKPRSIHKASVQDRLLHHVLYNALYPYFDSKFIYDSYSCRRGKGAHKALERFNHFARIVSKNHTQTCWVLKCDIRKFFASIDHAILLTVLAKHIEDSDLRWLLEQIITSFHTDGKQRVGLPLGNLTSQLLVNIYMNEFDQFVKHTLKEQCYIRYADDFVFLSEDKKHLEGLLPHVRKFLHKGLKLEMHPDKVFIKTVASGVDFLGWVHFPRHRVLRTATKRRMLRNLRTAEKIETLSSYKGMLSHGNAYKLSKSIDK
jgi:RNA-directed DNA polymerase